MMMVYSGNQLPKNSNQPSELITVDYPNIKYFSNPSLSDLLACAYIK